MKYYFGSIERKDLLDTEGMFTAKSHFNHMFYYGIEYGTGIGGLDELVVFDSCDRRVPIHIEAISEFIDVLHRIQEQYQNICIGKTTKARLKDPKGELAVVYASDDNESF